MADEPTTAMDVTIQAQIIELLKWINETRRTSAIFVTHDLALAAEFCHRIAVMYAGKIVEIGSTEAVMHDPKHPYTQGLLRSIPRISTQRQKIKPIPGEVPEPINLPLGCAFYARCEMSRPDCQTGEIALRQAEGRQVRCVLY
jgi:oligopeptide/dipeptide ABC transporter ATP-binding protein